MTKNKTEKDYSTRIAAWLFICAAAVFMMALIGAITRLTESGLSIVEWAPVKGAIPPLNAADWQREFDLYKETPQYIKVNRGMSLEEFKNIYFWEWLHRQWGRIIGLIYALPLLVFWAFGRLPPESKPAFAGILLLGFAQGAMGWLMVKSGLVDLPAVSHYRLAAHLMLAFLIYACLLRMAFAFSLRPDPDAGRVTCLRGGVKLVLGLAVLTMTWGAFVAGLRAGLVYNTFPMMDTHWFPPEMLAHKPVWKSFIEEPATVQFVHRVLGVLTLLSGFWLWSRARGFNPQGRVRLLLNFLPLVLVAQAGIGIVTLLQAVPVALGALHQGGALMVLTVLVWLLHDIPDIRSSK
ncbi:MAG: COX15/CtaA family protein [Parvibaculum sp.]|uniref:COX15/CtaA family protein n=1 Tax=Parvibaculum sp. TaxID=2024848 RepID=UPI0027303021|nr:COX15/CtaA family protein [Parvibaculum sp.]MDP2148829.1 COX15/CtaA family protein [Parvibaculum sp.]